MPGERPDPKHDVEDSASTVTDNNKSETSSKGRKPQKKGGSNSSVKRDASKPKTESSTGKQTPGFAEGNSVLTSYGLSVSGRKERILTPFKTEKFFHFVEQAWDALVDLKPAIRERFSFWEFRHASALQLYQRLESVKFDTLGIKPSAPTRIPLPRNTRVFQPIWSILANIGYVEDDDLRVVYIPDAVLPKTDDLSDPDDIEGLLACTLYDWQSSWEKVLEARSGRKQRQIRDGYTPITVSGASAPKQDRAALIKQIADMRKEVGLARGRANSSSYRIIDGYCYKIPERPSSPSGSVKSGTGSNGGSEISDADLLKTTKYWGPDTAARKLEALFKEAKQAKEHAIAFKYDQSYKIDAYVISDGKIEADAGAYGARLHWDPQLWLEYEQFVELVTPMALFSLSMPAETSGTYAWVLPVEKRDNDDSSVHALMPKASIAPATWILALLLQSSTLAYHQRSTFYVETDRLQNVIGLRRRYIKAAIKDPSAVETYGTY